MGKEKKRGQIVKEIGPDDLTPEGAEILNEMAALMNRSNDRMKRFMEGLEPGSIAKLERSELMKEQKEDEQKRKDIVKRLREYKKTKA